MKNADRVCKRALRKVHILRSSAIMIALVALVTVAHAWDLGWISQFGTGVFTSSSGGGKTDTTGVYTGGTTFPALPGQVLVGGTTDVYVRKFSFDGTILWTREFGTQGFDNESGVATGADGVYVAGRTSGVFPGQASAGGFDVFVRKYDPAGSILWTAQFGTPFNESVFPSGVVQRGSAVYVAGTTLGTFPGMPVGQGQDIYVAKLNSQTGALVWVRQFGVRGQGVTVGAVAVDDTGVYAASSVALGTLLDDPYNGATDRRNKRMRIRFLELGVL